MWSDAPQISIKYNGKVKKVASTQNDIVVYASFGAEKAGDFIEVEQEQLTPLTKDGIDSDIFFFL